MGGPRPDGNLNEADRRSDASDVSATAAKSAVGDDALPNAQDFGDQRHPLMIRTDPGRCKAPASHPPNPRDRRNVDRGLIDVDLDGGDQS